MIWLMVWKVEGRQAGSQSDRHAHVVYKRWHKILLKHFAMRWDVKRKKKKEKQCFLCWYKIQGMYARDDDKNIHLFPRLCSSMSSVLWCALHVALCTCTVHITQQNVRAFVSIPLTKANKKATIQTHSFAMSEREREIDINSIRTIEISPVQLA